MRRILCWILGHEERPSEVLDPDLEDTGTYPIVMTCICCERERVILAPAELMLGDPQERSRPGPWDDNFEGVTT